MATRALLLVAFLTACSSDDGTSSPAAAAISAARGAASTGSSDRDVVLAAWKKDGLEPSAMAPAQVPFGRDCQGGTVASIDVLLCAFPTPAEARAAEEPALAWVGAATGVSRARRTVLLVAADRGKSDPSGRTINQLVALAPK